MGHFTLKGNECIYKQKEDKKQFINDINDNEMMMELYHN